MEEQKKNQWNKTNLWNEEFDFASSYHKQN